MSLTDCIRKSGKALNTSDAESITKIAEELESSGISREEAEVQAVEQHLTTMRDDLVAMLPDDAPLKQESQLDEIPRGLFDIVEGRPTIGLSKKSDPSSFFHESMHMFIYMEGVFAKETGVDTNQQAILDHVGAESFDSMTREQHEVLAESFEAYLMEGKSPSVKLSDAFNVIRSWILNVYRSVRDLPNQKLDDNLREIFDKMLATEAEITEFTASPEYNELFKSKEQAGMTDAQWETYQRDIQKRKDRATTSVTDRIIKQIKARRTREWKKEKAPLIAAHKERLSKLPVYQILDNAKVEKMDTAAVKEIAGDNKKLMGKMVGKHKGGGIDPAIYSEAYGYTSPEQMFQDIAQSDSLGVAAEKAAEAQMVAKHGDILNDGSMEREIHEALHSTVNADYLRSSTRHAFIPGNTNHICTSTGTFS